MNKEEKTQKAKQLVRELSEITSDLQKSCHLIKVNKGIRGDIRLDIYKRV